MFPQQQKKLICCSTAVAQNYLQFHFYIEWFWIIEHRNSDLHQRCTGIVIKFSNISCVLIQSLSSLKKFRKLSSLFFTTVFWEMIMFIPFHPFLPFGLEYVFLLCSAIRKIDLELQGFSTKFAS